MSLDICQQCREKALPAPTIAQGNVLFMHDGILELKFLVESEDEVVFWEFGVYYLEVMLSTINLSQIVRP